MNISNHAPNNNVFFGHKRKLFINCTVKEIIENVPEKLRKRVKKQRDFAENTSWENFVEAMKTEMAESSGLPIHASWRQVNNAAIRLWAKDKVPDSLVKALSSKPIKLRREILGALLDEFKLSRRIGLKKAMEKLSLKLFGD